MVALKEELVLLSEGEADKAFLRALIDDRGSFASFDFPFPNGSFHGRSAFGRMLHALRGDPIGYAKLKGVLIVGDSADDPNTSFRSIADQIRSVGGFAVPTAPMAVGAGTIDHPAVAVMLLPSEERPGSLESLYVEDLCTRHQWVEKCVEEFLSCGRAYALNWSAEKAAKARFHSIVAAIQEEDPSRAASKVFRDPPVIDIGAACFDGVETRLRAFCAAVGAS